MSHPEDEFRVGGEHLGKQDDEEDVARVEEFKKSVQARLALRQSNLNPERPDLGFLRTLDSSIKRNTAVIKKLKHINEEQMESLMDELRSVNLSKFVSEAVTAISEAKLRSSDIQAAVQICSLLHQRYADFSASLIQVLLKVFFPGKSGDDLEAEKNLRAMKKRSTLKLLLELYFVGVIDGGIFIDIIKDLASIEHLKDRDATQTNLSLLASFARQGRPFLGVQLSGQEILEEFCKGLQITENQKIFVGKAMHTYYSAAAELLLSEHTSLRQMELENAKTLNFKDELSDENASSYEKLRKSYDHLYRGVSALAEALDMEPPLMPDDGHTTRITTAGDISFTVAGKDSSVLEPVWEDEETRTFYECLIDLRAFVPAVLLGEAEPKVNEQSSKTQEQPTDLAPESDQGQMACPDSAEVCVDSVTLQEGKNEKGKDEDEEEEDQEKIKDPDKENGKDKDAKRRKNKKQKFKALDDLLKRLPHCVSRDLIDQLTVDFCYLNSKSNRRKLVRALFNVPRTSLELLPYYSRMVATLSTRMKDVSSMLLQSLEEAFDLMIDKKDQVKIEMKIRNIRFIGELCKFRTAPAGFVFRCFKACFDDFSHHNIDVACNLIETCGRFLYRSPETTLRMGNVLDILMRFKKVKNLDVHHSTLVETAYYLCKPPERSVRVSKVRPPLHQYIRKLLFSDLDESSIEHVLGQLRKLPWTECEPYLLKCFMKVHKGNYGQIHLIASLVAGLSHYRDEFAVAVADEVLEEIRLGLELNLYGMQQLRIAHVRFLGELYNHEQLDSAVIFDTLYLVLFFGHGKAEQDVLDPPEDFFRIRMVITLLQTCGHYFDRGSSKRTLDQFLIHFQRYILCKGALPLDIEFDLQDLFADLHPHMTRYSSIEEVNEALIELEEHERKNSEMEKHPSRSTSGSISMNGETLANGNEENGVVHEAVADSDSDLGSGIIDLKRHDHEEGLDEENHDIDYGESDYGHIGGPASYEDEEVHVRQKVTEVDLQEEAKFDREFRALMQESLDSRKLEPRSRPAHKMTIPLNVFERPAKENHGVGFEGESGDETLDESGRSKEVRVSVLVKRGNKQQRTKQMYVPKDCSLVQSTKEREAADLEEKQDIKRLVLEYNYNDVVEEERNEGWMQIGGGNQTRTWQGRGRRFVGSYRRYLHYSGGGGVCYSRRK